MEIRCKICGSTQAKKNGIVSGFQRYKCKNCGHQYIKTTERGKSPKEKITALVLYNLGISKNFIAKMLKVSAPSIGRWIEVFTRQKLVVSPDVKADLQSLHSADIVKRLRALEEQNPSPFHVYRTTYPSGFEANLLIKETTPIPNNLKIKICAFGDSILRGVVRSSTQNKYSILRRSMTTSLPYETQSAYRNFAKHGSTVKDGEYTLDVHLEEVKESAYVFLLFGGNECNFDWDKVALNPNEDHQPKCSIEEFEERYTDLITKIKKENKIPVLFSLPPIDAEKYFNFLARNRNKENLLHFLQGDVQAMYRWHEMYNLAVFKIAKQNDVALIDITSAFLSQKDYHQFLCEDGIHPNEAGHALIAKIIRENYQQIK